MSVGRNQLLENQGLCQIVCDPKSRKYSVREKPRSRASSVWERPRGDVVAAFKQENVTGIT